MPKVVVYVRAEDARAIEAQSGQTIAEWTRDKVAIAIDVWKAMMTERNSQ